jgi:hypothetical protein
VDNVTVISGFPKIKTLTANSTFRSSGSAGKAQTDTDKALKANLEIKLPQDQQQKSIIDCKCLLAGL